MTRSTHPGHQSHHSDELRQRIVDLWARSDHSSATIAGMVGLTRNQVMGLCNRFMKGRGFPSRAYLQGQCRSLPEIDWWDACPRFDHATMPATPVHAHPLQLKANRGGGSAIQRRAIRAKTTPAGQGMKHQKMQLASAGSRGCREEQEVRKRERDEIAQALQSEFVQEFEEAERIRAGHDLLSDKVEGEPTSILDLRHGMCRAVIGEHPRLPGGMYCGSKVTTKAYCAAHHQLFYTTKWREPSIVKGIDPNKERGVNLLT